MKNRLFIILIAVISLIFTGATTNEEKLKLNFEYYKDKFIYVEQDYAFPNHLVYEEAIKRRINAPLNQKIEEVKRQKESGKSEKEAVLYCFPSISEKADEIAKKINISPTDSKVYFNPDQNPMFFVTKEKNGKQLDEEGFYRSIYNSIISGSQTIKIKTQPSFPEVCMKDNESTFYERGRFSTSITASTENRKDNIKTALNSINGTILEKGQTLSFNAKTGVRSEENGYKTAKIIKGNDYVEGVGGGVCQASTTLYNCALLSDVEVLEVKSHSLLPSYVLPSFDAMVNTGSSDLVIKNNTGGKLYIKAFANDETATVIFYGKKNEYEITRKSVTVKRGETPKDKIIIDKENKYFTTQDTGNKKRISYSQPSVQSQGYLIYKKQGKTQKEVLIREDYYNSKSGIIAERVENTLTSPLFLSANLC